MSFDPIFSKLENSLIPNIRHSHDIGNEIIACLLE